MNFQQNKFNAIMPLPLLYFRSLQTLDISYNKLTDLESIAVQFPSLEVLNVTFNSVSKWSTMVRCKHLILVLT